MSIEKMYLEVVKGNVYDLDEANMHTVLITCSGVKANQMPEVEAEFVRKNHVGSCLHYAMYLIKLLHDAGIKAYLTTTPEEDGAMHASVLYFDEKGDKHIADPGADIKEGTFTEHMCIDYDEFVREAIRNEIAHYDLYGNYGEEEFFGSKFLRECKLE